MSGKQHSDAEGVFTRAAPCAAQLSAPLSAPLSVLLKQASTSTIPMVECCCEMLQTLCFLSKQVRWPFRTLILIVSDRIPPPVFRSTANLVKWQIRTCIVTGCHLPDEENRACMIGSQLLVQRKLTPPPPYSHFEKFFSGNKVVAAHVNSTLGFSWWDLCRFIED